MRYLTTSLNTMTHTNFAVMVILIALDVPFQSVFYALCALLLHQLFLTCMAVWDPIATAKWFKDTFCISKEEVSTDD